MSNSTPNAVVGNYVDQGWLQSLPQFFQPTDARPALGRDAFLIPRDNLTIPQIVTRTTQGASDRGFIDVSRGRFDTIRNRINNPSSYNDQLHPSDRTSGTGGIDNLNDLSRFGHPLPYSNGEDIGMTKFMARFEGKDASKDPLSSSYAVANMGSSFGASMERRYAADRQIAKMMYDNYQKLKADIVRKDVDNKTRAALIEQQKIIAKQFAAKYAAGMMDSSRSIVYFDADDEGASLSNFMDNYETNSIVMGDTIQAADMFKYRGDSDPFRITAAEEIFRLKDDRQFGLPPDLYRQINARDVTSDGAVFAATKRIGALSQAAGLTEHEIGVLYRSPNTLANIIKHYNVQQQFNESQINNLNMDRTISSASKAMHLQNINKEKEQLHAKIVALMEIGNALKMVERNGMSSILMEGEPLPAYAVPLPDGSDMMSDDTRSTYSAASNISDLIGMNVGVKNMMARQMFNSMHDGDSFIGEMTGNTFNQSVDMYANYTSPNSVISNTDGGLPDDANDPNNQYPLVGKSFLDLDNLTDVEKQLQEGINTMRMMRGGAISSDKIQPSQIYSNNYVAVPPSLKGAKFDTERFVPGSTIMRSSNINIDKQSYEREITDPRYRLFAKLGAEKGYDSVGRDNPDQTAYSSITTELESQRIGNRIDGNVENPADRLAQGNTSSMSLIAGAGFNKDTTPLIAPINEVRGTLTNEVSQQMPVNIKDIKTQNYLATKRVNKDPFIWM